MTDRLAEFEAFAVAHSASLVRLSFLLCGDYARAEDAAQEALERVFVRWSRLDDPLPYARRVVVNATRDRWRRFGREHPTASPDLGAAVADEMGTVDDHDQLLRALRDLPYGQRAVVVLRFWQDLSEHDTAEMLHISIGTVKSQTSRALQRLRITLADPLTSIGGDHD